MLKLVGCGDASKSVYKPTGKTLWRLHELDHKTLEIIKQLAEKHHCTVSELMSAAVQQTTERPTNGDALLGLVADEPDLMDQVIKSAYLARQQHPLRRGDA